MVKKIKGKGTSGFPSTAAEEGVHLMRFGRFWVNQETKIPELFTMDNKRVARLECHVVESGEVQPGSSSVSIGYPDEMRIWMENFNLDYSRITDWSDPVRALLAVEKLAKEEGTRDLYVVVSTTERGSWINSVTLPDDTFFALFDTFIKEDDGSPKIKVIPKNHPMWGPYTLRKCFGFIKIIRGMWSGLHPFFMLDYALDWDEESQDFILATGQQSGRNMEAFCEGFGVEFDKLPRPANPHNGLPEIEAVILKKKKVAVVTYTNSFFDAARTQPAPKDFEVLAAGEVTTPEVIAPPKPEPEEKSVYVRYLYDAIQIETLKMFEKKAFDEGGNLTEAGRAYAKEKIKPLCESNQIPRNFEQMSDDHIIIVLEGIGYKDMATLVKNAIHGVEKEPKEEEEPKGDAF